MEFQRLFFLNFDWEMMTYWTIVGVSHALRYHYEAQDRALSASQLETRLIEAQLQTLQRQLQPHFLFNTLNTISALMHRDVEAADAMLAQLGDLLRLSFETVGVQEVSLEAGARLPAQVRGDRAGAVPRAPDGHLRRRARRSTTAWCQTFCCSRSSKTPSRHGIGPRVGPGHVLVRAVAQRARRWSSKCATTASACRHRGSPTSTTASGCRTRGRGWRISTATVIGSRCAARRAADCRW